MYVCVFAARPQYKRGHRKTASHGTILDIPEIVVTGIGAVSCRAMSSHPVRPLGLFLAAAEVRLNQSSGDVSKTVPATPGCKNQHTGTDEDLVDSPLLSK